MPPFKDFVIAATSDIERKHKGGLRNWVENNGGKYVTKPTKSMTHLICSKKMWVNGCPARKQSSTMAVIISLKGTWTHLL